MSSENVVQRRIWLALGVVSRLFRVNTGQAWVSGAGPAVRQPNGSVIVPGGRPVSLGFGMTNGKPLKGASDLCGWTTVKITPEMVGRDVAVFTAIETKRSSGGRTSPEQKNFVDVVRRGGGIAGVASDPEQALDIIEQWRSQLL